jgi:hypothetical protein
MAVPRRTWTARIQGQCRVLCCQKYIHSNPSIMARKPAKGK